MTRNEMFRAIGEMLFGDDYRVEMNVALAVHHPDGPRDFLGGRMVARWDDGRMGIPDWVMTTMLMLLREREAKLERSLCKLRQFANELSREVAAENAQ